MQTNKRRFLVFLLVVCFIALFIKWAEKGFASYGWEDVSQNERFKVEIYVVSEYRVYAKLYDNQTGKLIAESDIVDDGAMGGR
ncbi:hypothetical protein [Zooshikella harenae]|uniref:PepSY domain-containing protein n=1 Tax=Zooshikella harenae TaxID=2827238 RepID=A0ABS5ZHI9_9GAMM|nr:hypothetical protein [Zooshikella harenae]MBU2713529.1 hypothetical protein [Zooshikella harenae]